MAKYFVAATAVALTIGAAIFAEDKSPVGKSMESFSLPDVRTSKPVSLADFSDKKAVVVVFLGTQCPINNAYLPRLAELQKEYGGKGVQFLGINSIKTDNAEAVAEHAKKNDLPFPVLKDTNQRVADLFSARRTPEAFVLDEKHIVRYRGRIDDRFGIDVQRTKATKQELVDALDEVLASKTVTTPETEVAGCLITREHKAAEKATVTFTKDVSRILQK